MKVAFFVLLSVFVFQAIGQELLVKARLAKSNAVIEIDRCELMLRLNDIEQGYPQAVFGRAVNLPGRQSEKLVNQALFVIDSACRVVPEDPLMFVRAVIVCRRAGKSGQNYLDKLSALPSKQADALTHLVKFIYGTASVNAQTAKEFGVSLKTLLPAGWYCDQALLNLYKRCSDNHFYDDLKHNQYQRDLSLLFKIAFLVVAMAVLIVTGLLILLFYLASIWKQQPERQKHPEITAEANYGWLNVYYVFIAWLGTQIGIGLIAQPIVKNLFAEQKNILVVSLIVVAVYLLSNGPLLLYIYFFAARPNSLSFWDVLKLHPKMPLSEFMQMCWLGILAWVAAFPLMIVAYFISSQILGFSGSSNPIIAIVTQAARAQNLFASSILLLTVGVLAPICEEALFRGFLYTYLRRFWTTAPASLVSAGLFALVHFDPGGFLPLFTLGVVFAQIVEKSKCLLPSIVAHGLWNSATFLLVLLVFGG